MPDLLPTPPPNRPGRIRINHVTVAIMLKTILSGRFTIDDLRQSTGMHDRTLRKFIAHLRLQKLVHVADWAPDRAGALQIAVYELGNKPDRMRPRLTSAERSKRYRANLKLKKEKA